MSETSQPSQTQSNTETPENEILKPPADEQTTTKRKSDDVVISRITLNYIVIAVMFFAVGLLVGGMSFGSSVDEGAIEAAVENVLIDAGIMQAPVNMEFLVDDDPYLGDADAPIVIVEFSGYGCPFCGRHYQETLEPILENYGEHIRYVYRDFPSVNQGIAVPAALAANCAYEQNLFWDYHDALFINQDTLFQTQGSTIYLTQLASDVGLNVETFQTCLAEQTYLQEVTNDYNDGVTVGVPGTPAFYINGTAHSGAQPYEYFENVILNELEALGIGS